MSHLLIRDLLLAPVKHHFNVPVVSFNRSERFYLSVELCDDLLFDSWLEQTKKEAPLIILIIDGSQ